MARSDTPDEYNDPEASYRRGYQQGASAALEAATRVTTDKLRDWVGTKLANWRYLDRLNDRSVPPPSPN
jgi:hypothetical protein